MKLLSNESLENKVNDIFENVVDLSAKVDREHTSVNTILKEIAEIKSILHEIILEKRKQNEELLNKSNYIQPQRIIPSSEQEKENNEIITSLQSQPTKEIIYFSACSNDGFKFFAQVMGNNVTENHPMAKYKIEATGDSAIFYPITDKVGELGFNSMSMLAPVCDIEGNGTSRMVIVAPGKLSKLGHDWKVVSKCKISLS